MNKVFYLLTNKRVIALIAILLFVVGLGWSYWKYYGIQSGVAPSTQSEAMAYVLGILVAVAVVLLSVWFIWVVPQLQVQPIVETQPDGLKPSERFGLENEARKTVAQIVGGIVVIFGLLATGVNIAITQRETEKNRKLSLEGQITDRYTKAIAQLGDPKLEVRLGGIYALERIAYDSKRDVKTILEVLSAFVREKAPIQNSSLKIKHDADEKPATDIQAVLTVIGRLPANDIDWDLDLANTNLNDTDLCGADLRGARFNGVSLRGANLCFVNFSGARLRNADLSGANLSEANFSGGEFRFTIFPSTTESEFQLSHLPGADLTGAILSGANLRNTHFSQKSFNTPEIAHAGVLKLTSTKVNLARTGFVGVLNLEWNQLEDAVIDEYTLFSPEFEAKKKAKLAIQKTNQE